MSKMSGSTWMATAKPRRMCMPEEKCLMGTSMNFSNSENSTILSNLAFISFLPKPRIEPLR